MKFCILCLLTFLMTIACNNEGSGDQDADNNSTPLFQLLEPGKTGIDFVNEVVDGEAFNILTYRNFYNGGGVAIGEAVIPTFRRWCPSCARTPSR